MIQLFAKHIRGIEMNWNCIKWSAVCCLFLKCRKFKFNCTAVPSWSPDNSKCISFLWFSLQIQFPSFPRSNFTPCIPFPAKAAPCCHNWLFSVLWDKFHHQITLSNKSLQTIKCRPVSESSSPFVFVIKNFWPAVGSISDGSTALRHSATFRSSGR